MMVTQKGNYAKIAEKLTMNHIMLDKRKFAYKETFVHFTYKWNIASIKNNGLRSSSDGWLGRGIYCVKQDDDFAIDKAIKFIREEINWNIINELYGDKYIDLDEVIFAIIFEYTGKYKRGNNCPSGLDTSGYILIPKDNIPSSKTNNCRINRHVLLVNLFNNGKLIIR